MLAFCRHRCFGLSWIPAFAGMALTVPGLLPLLPHPQASVAPATSPAAIQPCK
jgi:hypothetical protein